MAGIAGDLRYGVSPNMRSTANEHETTEATGISPIEKLSLTQLQPDFYEARDWTRHIMQRADWMGMSREALLGAVLAVVSSRIPANVKACLTDCDEPMPLNLFVNLAGVTGNGKSRAIATAQRLCPDQSGQVAEINPASGEAISAQYVERVKDGDEWQVTQRRDRALMICTETTQVSALSHRTGSTLIPELLKAWSGETLGATTKTRELDLRVGAGLYRLSAVFGVQPAHAGIFVTEGTANGFAGRFLYFPTTDTTVKEDATTSKPKQKWHEPELPNSQQPVTITYPQIAKMAALRGIRMGTAGRVRDVDGHRVEQVARVAAIYALMDGRTVVTDEDWKLAEQVVSRSDMVRDWLFDEYRREAIRNEANRVSASAQARGEAEHQLFERLSKRIRKALEYGSMPRRDLGQKLARDYRYFSSVIDRMEAQGEVRKFEDDRGRVCYEIEDTNILTC